jgi:PilZ domain
MSDEKREGSRVAMIGRLEGEVMVFQPMAIKEVSLRGALVETRFALNLNSLHDLRIELGERSVVVKGRVVHSQIADVEDDVLVYWTGIEFVEPSEHVSIAIAEFLKSVRAERH